MESTIQDINKKMYGILVNVLGTLSSSSATIYPKCKFNTFSLKPPDSVNLTPIFLCTRDTYTTLTGDKKMSIDEEIAKKKARIRDLKDNPVAFGGNYIKSIEHDISLLIEHQNRNTHHRTQSLMICPIGCSSCPMSNPHKQEEGNNYGCYNKNKKVAKNEN